MWKIPLFELNYDWRETQAIQRVLDSRWLTMGDNVRVFENQFADFLNSQSHALAVSNGTAALHMALLAVGVGPGDDVMLPALTFVADINAVLLTGARPVLIDCTSYRDWNLNPEDVGKNMKKETKAVIAVHYAGYPCRMDRIKEELKRSSSEQPVYIIEDAAHAPGATYKDKQCGTLGDIGCFSFFSNKNLSIGEGGMFVTASEIFFNIGSQLRSHGMTSMTLDRHEGRAVSYDVLRPGLNYRLDELRAALGRVQLEKLPAANDSRANLVKRYNENLGDLAGLSIPFLDHEHCRPSYHIYPILLDRGRDRKAISDYLKQNGIQSSIHYPCFQDFSAFQDLGLRGTPIAREISQRELTLPLFPAMSYNQVDFVCRVLKDALSRSPA